MLHFVQSAGLLNELAKGPAEVTVVLALLHSALLAKGPAEVTVVLALLHSALSYVPVYIWSFQLGGQRPAVCSDGKCLYKAY